MTDKIEARAGRSITFPNGRDSLYIFVNGERLDLLLSAESGQDLRDLVPFWLDLNGGDSDIDGVRDYVREHSRLAGGDHILPVLLCPDDFDFSCLTVVVEVSVDDEKVFWKRFGLDVTEPPRYIGETIEWLDGPGPFVFDRGQYLDCLAAFERWRPKPPAGRENRDDRSSFLSRLRGLKGSADKPSLIYMLYAFWGCLFINVGSGVLNLPALAFRLLQYELAESGEPPKWSFVRLLPLSGFQAVGLDASEKYLLAAGRDQRQIFSLADGRRIAKEEAAVGEGRPDQNPAGATGRRSGDDLPASRPGWGSIHSGIKSGRRSTSVWAQGSGPLDGQLIRLWGVEGARASKELMAEARRVSNGLSTVRTALASADARLLIVGQDDGIYVFERVENSAA